MKQIILILSVLLIGCNSSEPVIVKKDSFYISVRHELVCKSILGYVNYGSVLYNSNSSEKGYRIDIKNNDKIISTVFAGDNLSEIIETLKYQHCQKDSIIQFNDCR